MVIEQVVGVMLFEVRVKVSTPVLVTPTEVPQVLETMVNGCPAGVPQSDWMAFTWSMLDVLLAME